MLPNPIPYSESELLLLQRRFHFLVSFFSITFSSKSNFLLNCVKDCFTGLGFFPPFSAAQKSDFSVTSFSNQRQSQELCVVQAPPCFLQRSRFFLVRAFFGTLGLWSVPGCYVPFLSLCEGFSSQEGTDFLDLTWQRLSLCKAFSMRGALDLSDISWPHTRSVALRDRMSKTHVHRSPTFLVKVELIPPHVQARL
jgi:hypothetical protein